MEYWEFLIQKEGDRTWKPVKSPKIEIEPGRYRVVAHSNLKNAEVEISVIHQSVEEVPPRRRYQKRSRRTSPEGLMVVIPFTQLKSGIWELRCCGDIMSEFLGDSWQESIQLQVVNASETVLPQTQPKSSLVDSILKGVPADLRENTPIGSGLEPMVATTQAKTEDTSEIPLVATSESQPVVVSKKQGSREQGAGNREQGTGSKEQSPPRNQPTPNPSQEGNRSRAASVSSIPSERCAASEATSEKPLPETAAVQKPESSVKNQAELTSPVSQEVFQQENNGTTENGQDAQTTTLQQWDFPIANPILEQSLQTLEQIMEQVLEPVLDEFEQSESIEQQPLAEPTQIPATAADEVSKTIANRLGLIITLDEEALVAQREESLAVVGQLDVLNPHQLEDRENQRAWEEIFPGILCYELRNPQTSKVLVKIQHPLSEQAPPLTFSQELELPSNCNTRLLVGKVTFYGSNSQALVSQSFTVTADLDDVLGSILLGGKTMPVETMMAVANHLTTSQEHQQQSTVSASVPLNEALLDLVDAPPTIQPRTWERSSSNPLPPQIHQRDSSQKSSKSLDLPNFPKLSSVCNGESDTSEVISSQLSPSILASLPLTLSTVVSQPEEVELKQEDSEYQNSGNEQLQPEVPVNLVDNLSLNQQPEDQEEETADLEQSLEGIQSPDTTVQEDSVTVGDTSANVLEARELSEFSSNSDSVTSSDVRISPETVTEVGEVPKASVADTQLRDSDSIGEADSAELEMPSAEEQTPQASADETNHIENDFQALNLQDRFWSRLNSLVTDADSSTSLESDLSAVSKTTEIEKLRHKLNSNGVNLQQAGVQEQLLTQEQLEFTEQLPPETVMADFDESLWEGTEDFGGEVDTANSSFVRLANTNWVNQEIVVEEELVASPPKTFNGDASGIVNQEQLKNQSAPEINYPAASDVSIPAPKLFISTSELGAGEPVTVRIKLPPHPSRLYVKLWIKDRQSRSILDGPRSFVDFLPNASGELEELTQLIVPFGTVEIRFEAIAIDMYSQRESHKVAVDCKVVSPDLPSISLEEFET
ncbi:MAG: hypothetical protein F6K14_14045 [Symploca sp. SIO2C1]|nr:hypothetical protein [Symploca sp. SIO2C1]